MDTTGDGLTDYENVRLGLDPTTNDTDPATLPDAEQSHTTTASDEESGVEMSPTSGVCPSGETIDQWYNHIGSSTAPADEIAQHVGVVNRQLDDDAETVAMELVVREGDDGGRLIDWLKPTKWTRVQSYSESVNAVFILGEIITC